MNDVDVENCLDNFIKLFRFLEEKVRGCIAASRLHSVYLSHLITDGAVGFPFPAF